VLVLGLLLGLYLNWGGRGSRLQDNSESHAMSFLLGLLGVPGFLALTAVFLVLVGIKLFRG
jgi:hypothetical protein